MSSEGLQLITRDDNNNPILGPTLATSLTVSFSPGKSDHFSIMVDAASGTATVLISVEIEGASGPFNLPDAIGSETAATFPAITGAEVHLKTFDRLVPSVPGIKITLIIVPSSLVLNGLWIGREDG